MSTTEKTISALVGSQLPDFISAEHPKFLAFVQKYYEWLETNNLDGISNTAGNTIYQAMNIDNYRDIDQTPPEFIRYFKQELIPYFPENTSLSTEKILKSAREFYSKKGSPDSVKWLFKVLFDEDIEITYPKEQILKTSDGKWIQPKAFRITVSETNKNVDVALLKKRMAVGVDSGATCVIESASRSIDPTNGKEIIEIYISNIVQYFNNGEFITIDYVDENGVDKVFRERLIGTLSNVRIDSNLRTDPTQRRRGLLYNVGDPIVITGGLGSSAEANDGVAIVGNVSIGSIEGVATTFPGYGYLLYSNSTVLVLRSQGDATNANLSTDLRITDLNLSACTANSQNNFLESVTFDKTVIDYLGDTVIGDANLAAFTLNVRNIVLNVTEADQDDDFDNYEQVWANGLNFNDALFTAKIATPNGNTRIAGTVNVSSTSNVVIGSNTAFAVELKVGQKLEVAGNRRTIDVITNNYHLTTSTAYPSTLTNQNAYRIGNFAAHGGFGTQYTGSLLLYDIANTGSIATILTGAPLYTKNTSKSFTFNSITTAVVPANANSQIFQCLDFATVNTGGIALISVLNGGGGFRSEPALRIATNYQTQLSENYSFGSNLYANSTQTLQDLGLIAHVHIDNGGSLYSVNDIITFEGRGYGGNGYVQAVDANGGITSVVLSDRGEGYLARPNVYVKRASPTYTAITGTANIATGSSIVYGDANSIFTTEIATTDLIKVNNEIRQVISIANNRYLTVNAVFNTTGNGNTIYMEDGTEASFTAYLFGDGAENTVQTGAIGRVRDIRLIYRGYDYVATPNVSMKVLDTIINPVPETSILYETEVIYQGANLQASTFRANVKSLNKDSNLLRLYNYSGTLNTTIDLVTANGVLCNVNTSMNVPAPAQYEATVRSTGLPNPMTYGNGRAKANAQFANGLIQFDGFFLNTDGFPSADKVLQDGTRYHNFSYMVQSEKSLADFQTPIFNIVHPSGLLLVAKTINKTEEDTATLLQSNVDLIMPGNGGSTVNVTNSYANVVTGTNTLFAPLANNINYSNTRVNVGDMIIINDGDRLPISKVVSNVVSNTVLYIAGDFIYRGQGLANSTITFDTLTGTANVTAACTHVIGNNSTAFNTELASNNIIKVNNEVREVISVTNSKHLIVNSAFTYSGTDNVAYKLANTVLMISGNSNSLDTIVQTGDNVSFNIAVANVMGAQTGTVQVFTTNGKVVGTSTLFTTQLKANDFVMINNQLRQVINIANATVMNVNTSFTSNVSGEILYKRATYQNANVVSITGNTMTLNIAYYATVSDLVYLVVPNLALEDHSYNVVTLSAY